MTRIADRYEIVKALGQGGMGEVHLAHDHQTQRYIAVKELRSHIRAEPELLARFRREGAALRELDHPNIVKMLEMLEYEGQYYIIMEYIDGGDLAHLLKQRGRLAVNEAVQLALELTDALARAHHLGIIHRDLKPGNVLIASDGTPRLTDFGVAHIDAEERLTVTGDSVGTLDYMPPEAINGHPVDMRGDIWSFGIMLYEMLAGKRPFAGDTTLRLLNNILTQPLPPIAQDVDHIPADLQDLLNQMLEKDPEKRLRSARQLGAALEAILRNEPLRITPTPAPDRLTERAGSSTNVERDIHDVGNLPSDRTPHVAVISSEMVSPTATDARFPRRGMQIVRRGQRLPWTVVGIAIVATLVLTGVLLLQGVLLPPEQMSDSVVMLDSSPEKIVTSTAASEELILTIDVPSDWQLIQRPGFSLSIPNDWLTLSPSIELVQSAIQAISLDVTFRQLMLSLVDQVDLKLMIGHARALDSVAGGIGELKSSVELDERALDLSESIFKSIGQDAGMDVFPSETVPVSSGIVRRFLMRLPEAEGQYEMDFIMYLHWSPATRKLYLLSFTIFAGDYEQLAPVIASVVASFRAE